AVFALLAVIAGFAGGFAAGYVANDDDERDGAGATVAAIGAEAVSDAASASGWARPGDDAAVATTVVGGMPEMPTRERVLKRASSSGHSVQVFRTEFPRFADPGCSDEEGVWCPPPECFPNVQLEVYVIGEWSVAH